MPDTRRSFLAKALGAAVTQWRKVIQDHVQLASAPVRPLVAGHFIKEEAIRSAAETLSMKITLDTKEFQQQLQEAMDAMRQATSQVLLDQVHSLLHSGDRNFLHIDPRSSATALELAKGVKWS